MNADNFLRAPGDICILPGTCGLYHLHHDRNPSGQAHELFFQNKINPLLGAAGVSAVPMAARVVHKVGMEADKKNYLLMYAMGPNGRRCHRHRNCGRHFSYPFGQLMLLFLSFVDL